MKLHVKAAVEYDFKSSLVLYKIFISANSKMTGKIYIIEIIKNTTNHGFREDTTLCLKEIEFSL
jgi:hypothetical protein